MLLVRRFQCLAGFVILLLVTGLFSGCSQDKAAPSIPSSLTVTPLTDTIDGTVTITGAAFNTNPQLDTVWFNSTSSVLASASDGSKLSVVVPGSANTGRITVKVGGSVWQTVMPFTVAPKFAPQSGGVGTVVTLTGAGFSGNLTDNIVKFNGVQATVTGVVLNQLTVPVPAGAATGTISVSVKGQTVTSLIPFTVTP